MGEEKNFERLTATQGKRELLEVILGQIEDREGAKVGKGNRKLCERVVREDEFSQVRHPIDG